MLARGVAHVADSKLRQKLIWCVRFLLDGYVFHVGSNQISSGQSGYFASSFATAARSSLFNFRNTSFCERVVIVPVSRVNLRRFLIVVTACCCVSLSFTS